MREAVKERDDYRCVICHRGTDDGVDIEVDHRVRWIDNGEDTMENLETLCIDHHKEKTRAEAARDRNGPPRPSRDWF